MFNNLIESSSHLREYKRRGSFLLFTSAIYVALFAVTGVVAIYAYDARLERQSLEFVTLLPPQEFAPTEQPTKGPAERPRVTNEKEVAVAEREFAMPDVDRPEVVPEKVSAAPYKNLPLPPVGDYRITGKDLPAGPGAGRESSSGDGGGRRRVVQPAREIPLPDNPPLPEPPQQAKVVSLGVITGKAISLPKPVYSEIAKRMRVEGPVRVQVLVDLDGRVVSASVVNGSPFLRAEAQNAAMQARFSPTLLNNQPVKVSGIIVYNFQLNH